MHLSTSCPSSQITPLQDNFNQIFGKDQSTIQNEYKNYVGPNRNVCILKQRPITAEVRAPDCDISDGDVLEPEPHKSRLPEAPAELESSQTANHCGGDGKFDPSRILSINKYSASAEAPDCWKGKAHEQREIYRKQNHSTPFCAHPIDDSVHSLYPNFLEVLS